MRDPSNPQSFYQRESRRPESHVPSKQVGMQVLCRRKLGGMN